MIPNICFKSKLNLFLIFTVLTCNLLNFAQAQTTQQTPGRKISPGSYRKAVAPSAKVDSSADDEVKFSADIALSYEQKGTANKEGKTPKSNNIEIDPKITYGDFSLLGYFYYTYDLNNPSSGSDWDIGVVSLLYHVATLANVKIEPIVSVELPFSKNYRERDEIEYVTNGGFKLSLDTKALDVPKFNLSYSALYGYIKNKYSTSTTGDPANDHKIVQTIKSSYSFDPVTVGFKFKFTSNYSYDNVIRNGFFHSEFINYSINSTYGITVYHYNAGPLLNSTTYENNLKAYSEDSSNVGIELDISI